MKEGARSGGGGCHGGDPVWERCVWTVKTASLAKGLGAGVLKVFFSRGP